MANHDTRSLAEVELPREKEARVEFRNGRCLYTIKAHRPTSWSLYEGGRLLALFMQKGDGRYWLANDDDEPRDPHDDWRVLVRELI